MDEDRCINTNIVPKSISPTSFSKSISKYDRTTIIMQTFLVLGQTNIYLLDCQRIMKSKLINSEQQNKNQIKHETSIKDLYGSRENISFASSREPDTSVNQNNTRCKRLITIITIVTNITIHLMYLLHVIRKS